MWVGFSWPHRCSVSAWGPGTQGSLRASPCPTHPIEAPGSPLSWFCLQPCLCGGLFVCFSFLSKELDPGPSWALAWEAGPRGDAVNQPISCQEALGGTALVWQRLFLANSYSDLIRGQINKTEGKTNVGILISSFKNPVSVALFLSEEPGKVRVCPMRVCLASLLNYRPPSVILWLLLFPSLAFTRRHLNILEMHWLTTPPTTRYCRLSNPRAFTQMVPPLLEVIWP